MGCGEGDTLAFLEETRGVAGVGLDRSEELLRRGREKRPRLDLRRGEMETLDFPSFEFDAVVMECSLSLSSMQLESLHEAWCVLKKGGKLILADLYVTDPDPAAVARAREEARNARNAPREEGDCERGRGAPSEYCLSGAFVKESLCEAFDELGFELLLWRDETELLRAFVAEKIFEHGSLAAFWRSALPPGADENDFCRAPVSAKNIGYFLAVLMK
jgi:SAM-dependent methyltransferase